MCVCIKGGNFFLLPQCPLSDTRRVPGKRAEAVGGEGGRAGVQAEEAPRRDRGVYTQDVHKMCEGREESTMGRNNLGCRNSPFDLVVAESTMLRRKQSKYFVDVEYVSSVGFIAIIRVWKWESDCGCPQQQEVSEECPGDEACAAGMSINFDYSIRSWCF